MSSFGVLSTGFSKKPRQTIIDEITAGILADISPNLNTTSTAILGQLIGVFADQISEDWDVLEDVYESQYPDTAADASLDGVVSLIGATRLPATKSTVTLIATGDNTTLLPLGRQARVPSGGIFDTLAATTLALATAWAPATAYSIGDIRSSDANIYVAVGAGTSAAALVTSGNAETYALVNGQTLTVKVDGAAAQTVTFNTGDFVDIALATAAEVAAVITTDLSSPAATGADAAGSVTIVSDSGGQVEVTGGTANTALAFPTTIFGGPQGEGVAIIDGGVTWRFLGDGLAFNTVAAQANLTGVVVGLAFQITEIVTAVGGWLSVNNQLDAVEGVIIETDAALRIRREALLTVIGKGTVDTIRAKLINVANVTEALVFENTTDFVDSNGLPGHSIEAVVLGGTDIAIATAIFDDKAAGIETFGGDISEVIVDTQGTSHTILASRADTVEMFLDITVITDGNYPSDGDAQVETQLLALADTLLIGSNVIYDQFRAETLASAGGVSGVVDISTMFLDKRPVAVTAGNSENYVLVDGQTLTVKVDGQSSAQTVTFNTADFVDIGAATAEEVAIVITADLTTPPATGSGATAPVITSDSSGTIEVTGGTANGALGFPTTFTPTGVVNVPILSRQRAVFNSVRLTVVSI